MDERTKGMSEFKKEMEDLLKKQDRQAKKVADLERRLAKARKELNETKVSLTRKEKLSNAAIESLQKWKNTKDTQHQQMRDKIAVLRKLNDAHANLETIRDEMIGSVRERASALLKKQHDPTEIDSKLFDLSRRLVSECFLYIQLQEKCHSFLLNRIVDVYRRKIHIEGDIDTLSSLGSDSMGTNLEDLRRRVKSLTIAESDDRSVLLTLASQTASVRDSLNSLWSDEEYLSLIHISEPTRPY